MKDYKITWFGILFAILLYLLSLAFHLDLFELSISLLREFEHFEIDELILPLVIIFICFVADILKHRKNHKIESEKVKIYKAMLSSSHHILNNFLNKMTLVKLSAEENKDFPKEVIEIIERASIEASVQIKALSNIEEVDDQSILDSVFPK